MEKSDSWYPCNPLWAQLGDLYGALGNPAKMAQTVVAGDSRKSDLINSVLSFLSYFIRSGAIRKCQEYRCASQHDVQQATDLLEQPRGKRAPCSFSNRRPAGSSSAFNDRDTSIERPESRVSPTRSSGAVISNDINVPRYPQERSRISRSNSPFKRSGTVKSDLDALVTKSMAMADLMDLKSPVKRKPAESENCPDGKCESVRHDRTTDDDKETNITADKLKIIVDETEESRKNVAPKIACQPRYRSEDPRLRDLEIKLNARDVEESLTIGKPELRRRLDRVDDMSPLKTYRDEPRLLLDRAADEGYHEEFKESQVFFTVGGEDKSAKLASRPSRLGNNNCQCSYTFTRVPSTSAQLPEGVLRKIIQRNFPESSKGIQPPPGAASAMDASSIGFCLKCNGQGAARDYDGCKQEVLETPTNATEVLRTCGNSEGSREKAVGLSRSNSLEALMEASSVVELPMPQLVYRRGATSSRNEVLRIFTPKSWCFSRYRDMV